MLKNILITCFFIGLLLFFGYKILEKNNKNKVNENLEEINEVIENIDFSKDEENIEDKTNIEEDIITEETPDKSIEEAKYDNPYYKNYNKAYSQLLKINNDTVGWLVLNNTKINYPVVKAKDNDYYLTHSFDKTKNNLGWIFVDYRNNMDILDKNTIIYGHSMIKNGLMFSTLNQVIKSEWYNNEENLILSFSVKGKEIKWRVFSIYTIEVTNDYLQTEFSDDDSYTNFVNKLASRSIKNFNVEINSNDKILTLSTCYKDDNHRIVLHAKMI